MHGWKLQSMNMYVLDVVLPALTLVLLLSVNIFNFSCCVSKKIVHFSGLEKTAKGTCITLVYSLVNFETLIFYLVNIHVENV